MSRSNAPPMPADADAARFDLDKRALRAARDRAAPSYDTRAVLEREVCERMLDRLQYIKHQPASILDAGAAIGCATERLRTLYPAARLLSQDLSIELLRARRPQTPWWEKHLPFLRRRWSEDAFGADLEKLPLRSGAVDMVWSNCALFWYDPPRAIREMKRVLRPGGLLMLSTLGPDTLKQLRECFAAIDKYVHVNRFMDMHDLGDLLTGERFADPVIDMEMITLTYSNITALFRDLRESGVCNANRGRRIGLMSKAALDRVAAEYERLRSEGALPASFEIVYVHAWRGIDRAAEDGRQIVRFDRLKRPA
jgi:malonyl-CoA O-methyltransferase